MTLKILNLYAGIGGNRKLWDGDIHVTAVGLCPKIAAAYQELYPNDTVVVGDAHEYLRKHFREFDFIWASPPCPICSHHGIRREDNGKFYIECTHCHIRTKNYALIKFAITDWNKRKYPNERTKQNYQRN